MEDARVTLIKAKYNAAHYPYEDKDFKPAPRKISDVHIPGLSAADTALFEKIENERNTDPMVGAKLAGFEISNNLMNALKDKKGGVQIESLFAAIGSLAGRELLNGINAVLGIFSNGGNTKEAENARLAVAYAVGIVIADTKEGQKYLFGDEIGNRFTRFFYLPISPNAKIEDLVDLAAATAGSVGNNYWKTSFDGTIGVSPQFFADKLQAVSARSLLLYCRFPFERLLSYAIAAQLMIKKANGIIDEKTALRIVAEYGWKTAHFNVYFL
jgi:hypothetical protein